MSLKTTTRYFVTKEWYEDQQSIEQAQVRGWFGHGKKENAIIINLDECWSFNFVEKLPLEVNIDLFLEQFIHTVVHEEVHKTLFLFGVPDGLDWIENVVKEAIL